MMSSLWIWTTFAAAILASLFLFNALVKKNNHKNLPPGPRRIPIIGHLPLLGKNPHQDLDKLAKKYGPIMRLNFGFLTNIIISSPKAAGIQLGLTMVRLVVAELVHCFDWELPNEMLPEDLDMTEEVGLIVSRAKHLMAIPSYRLITK